MSGQVAAAIEKILFPQALVLHVHGTASWSSCRTRPNCWPWPSVLVQASGWSRCRSIESCCAYPDLWRPMRTWKCCDGIWTSTTSASRSIARRPAFSTHVHGCIGTRWSDDSLLPLYHGTALDPRL